MAQSLVVTQEQPDDVGAQGGQLEDGLVEILPSHPASRIGTVDTVYGGVRGLIVLNCCGSVTLMLWRPVDKHCHQL